MNTSHNQMWVTSGTRLPLTAVRNAASLLTILLFVLTTISYGQYTGFSYSTGPDRWSYIAQGSGLELPENGTQFFAPYTRYPASQNYSNSLELSIYTPAGPIIPPFQFPTPDSDWNINLHAPNNGLLEEGVFIATRYPFNSPDVMGFTWYGNGRGLNISTSWVEILEVEYIGVGGPPSKLAFDFVQFEEISPAQNPTLETSRWSFGSYRYNSSVPLNVVPEPSTSILGMLGMLLIARRKRQS